MIFFLRFRIFYTKFQCVQKTQMASIFKKLGIKIKNAQNIFLVQKTISTGFRTQI